MSQGLLNISIKRLGLLAISILFYSNFVADTRECYSDILLRYDPYYQLKCFGFHQFGKKGTFSVYFLPLFSIRWRILSNCILLKVTSSPQAGNFLGLGLREVVLCTDCQKFGEFLETFIKKTCLYVLIFLWLEKFL